MYEDSYLHKGLRKKLVDSLKNKGIENENVLNAINSVPRHLFMDSGFIRFAYKDQAFPISSGQTISQPYTVAFQTQLLDVHSMDMVLEIGTGSGYQAAVLASMGARVYTIERHRDLYLKSRMLLTELKYRVHFFYGDGYLGLPTYGPFDRILITAAIPEVPETLIEQLKPGGKLVMPLGKTDTQIMTLLEKTSEGEIKSSEHGRFIFVPMLKGKG